MLLDLSSLREVAVSWTSPSTSSAALAILGVLWHRFYLIKGEHHLQGAWYLAIYGIANLILAFALSLLRRLVWLNQSQNYPGVLSVLIQSNVAFLAPMFGSIIIYRLFQHPLKDFRGPRLAAVSKLWHLYHVFGTENHALLDSLHHKYGSIVRTGPQELTIIDPAVLQDIGGPGTSCVKAPWYDMLWPFMSLNSIRIKAKYGARRRRWDEALRVSGTKSPESDQIFIASSKSSKESRLQQFVTLLLRQIDSAGSHPVGISTWFHYFSFDFMGDMAFGHSFALISSLQHSDIEPHYAPSLISQGMWMLRFFTPTPWLGHLCLSLAPYIPFITQKWNKALSWAAETCDARLREYRTDVADNSDVFGRFISSAVRDGDQDSLDRLALYGDAFAITVAGSHTTATVLTMLFHELAQRPELQDALRKEIYAAGAMMRPSQGGGLQEHANIPALENLALMDGCINETMRLYPPVPTGGIRQTTDKGMIIAGEWVPPNTIIVAPRWSIGRLQCAFEEPNNFIPERWTSKPELVKDERAHKPFGTGRHSCPGKRLGMLEVRMVTAMLLTNFKVVLCPPIEKPEIFVAGFRDHFTGQPGQLKLAFIKNSESEGLV
ncbi:cytochrome P450 [Xylariaceae sp. FL0804]|nr:cytochrome P450 [Xylariaceae sp. FL0804]